MKLASPTSGLTPRPPADVPPYAVPRAGAPTDLRLDANEGPMPEGALLDALSDVAGLRAYPSAGALEARIARDLGVVPAAVLVTAGADDALDRACRAVLSSAVEVIMPTPGFSAMLRWIALSEARHVDVAWPDGPYPTEAVSAAVTSRTRMIVVTTPNNPTGAVATPSDLRALSRAAPDAMLLVDLAYTEFADADLTRAALGLPNVVVTRTLSKAWGLAGLRVGYAVGHPTVLRWMRSAGLPYAVGAPSLVLAGRALDDPSRMHAFVDRVRDERRRVTDVLAAVGARPQPSQANFVLARVDDPLWWRDGLAGLGIAIRAFPGVARLEDAIRIGCPGDAAAMDRFAAAVTTLARPMRLVVESLDGSVPDRLPAAAEPVVDVDGALDERPTWVVARTTDAVAAARTHRALPLALQALDLVAHGAARSIDAEALAARWSRVGPATF